jgi:hypothetical protein
MRQAGSKEYAHELVELLPGSQLAGAIEMLELMVGTSHLALVGATAEESSVGQDQEMLGHGEVVVHEEFLADHGGPAEP